MPSPSTSAPFFNKGALHRLASGLEAGVIGGMAMLVLLVAGSMWRGDVWWAPANLLGSTFYGRRAFRAGLGMATLSGTAFHIVITGTVGALFGLACGGVRERRRLVVLGALAGIFWYYFADAVFWSHVNRLVPAYAPQPMTLVAHALFGACLGYMGQNLGRENFAGSVSMPAHLPVYTQAHVAEDNARVDPLTGDGLAEREGPENYPQNTLRNTLLPSAQHSSANGTSGTLEASSPGLAEVQDLHELAAPAASEIPAQTAAQETDSTPEPPPLPHIEPVGHERGHLEIG